MKFSLAIVRALILIELVVSISLYAITTGKLDAASLVELIRVRVSGILASI